MGKLTKGIEERRGAFGFGTAAPLDDRAVVKNLASLIGLDTWITIKYLYVGLQTIVQSTKEIYICKVDGANYTSAQEAAFLPKTTKTDAITDAVARSTYQDQINLCWEKVPSSSDIKGLSGVFQFKGVAEAISLDQRVITTRGVNTQAIKNEQQQVIKNSEPLYCVTTAYEFDMDVYYGWGTSLNDIRFWTDTTTVNSNTPQYDKGGQTEITAFEFNDKLYYPTGTKGKYESIDGEVVYIADNKVYETDDFTKTSIGAATEVSYTGCEFSVKSSPIALQNTTSETIAASSANSGHVYQIGENEYASNGQIWVKLGSPVEDWIII